MLGVVGLVAATALCSVVSFTAAQRVVVDMGNSGIDIPSNPFDAARLALNRNSLESTPQNQPVDVSTIIAQLPTATAIPQLVVTSTPLGATGETAQPTKAAATQPAAQTQALAGPTATTDPVAGYQWKDPRRFNVLLLGIDQRTGTGDDEKYFRTDTIMVMSIDPVRKTAGLLSIPRDLWVAIPGFKEGRINTANALGDSSQYPDGGPGLAAETIRQDLGIDIDAYVRINFTVFEKVVSIIAPDGAEVCPQEVIDDPHYPDAGYGMIHVHFDPGCQRLQATQLLQYARTRITQGGDFDRSRRQQEVLRSLQKEVLSAGGIAHFLTQIPVLWDELAGSYTTNLKMEDIISLANLGESITPSNINFGVIDNHQVKFATTSSGDQVLLPNYDAIRSLIQDTFNPKPKIADVSLADLKTAADAEKANIVVFNNTDTPGLAASTREWLISRGITVTALGNIPNPTGAPTTLRNYNGKPNTARYLAALLGLSEDRIEQGGSDQLTSADVMVVIGPDIQTLLSAAPSQ
jgi:LCP family protein required for cell wall assembly